MAIPKLFKETNVFKKNAIVNGITDAAKRATSYVTDLTNGIFVHRENDTSSGVKIQDTVEIIKGNDSVAEYGTTARVGKSSTGHLLLEALKMSFYIGANQIPMAVEQVVRSATDYFSKITLDEGSTTITASHLSTTEHEGESVYINDLSVNVGNNNTRAAMAEVSAYGIDGNSSIVVSDADIALSSTGPIMFSNVLEVHGEQLSSFADWSQVLPGLTTKALASSDLDDVIEPGLYTYASGATNAPVSTASGALIVIRRSANYVTQIASISSNSSTATPGIYVRRTYGSSTSWTGWYKFNLTAV